MTAARTFDEQELLQRVDNDLAFLAETVQMLDTDGRAMLRQIDAALAAGDATAVGRAGHALKGMISNFCAAQAYAGALEVERLGKQGDLAAASVAAKTLEGSLAALLEELTGFVKAGGA